MIKRLVYPKLPKSGLGNMLLVWARAVLFAEINKLPIVSPNWGKIHIGPYLRGERDKRYYGNLFVNQDCLSIFQYLMTKFGKQELYSNPAISKIELTTSDTRAKQTSVFVFDRIPHWSDYFVDLKEFQPLIKQKLLAIVRKPVLETIVNNPAPEISIHARMSDFRKVQPGEDFTRLGNARTPMDWYISVINAIRKIAGYDIPVTIFSDGSDRELGELLQLDRVSRSSAASALSDMLTLSKSKLLIASSGSTFSGWASYLGECTTVWHPAHFHAGVFSSKAGQTVFEGGFDPESKIIPDLLVSNIKSRFC
jgi:hypothetical protein